MTPVVWLFGSALFVSSFLMFVIEPMITKMVLPQLGGGPMVWNTCLVFFQSALLAGYSCAHGATRLFGVRRSVVVYGLLLLLPWFWLPVSLSTLQADAHGPAGGLLLGLTASIGVPFLVLSMSAPALQRWFSATTDPLAGDPFFLYAASNVGSLLALLTYPTLVEPRFPLPVQARLWSAGYAGFVLLAISCGVAVWRGSGRVLTVPVSQDDAPPVGWARRLEWLMLATVPSSLLLGVTTYLSTDIAAVPLLWVIPLSLYLLTFVLAFGSRANTWGAMAFRRLPLLVTAVAVFMAGGFGLSVWLLMPLHLAAFAMAALMCHSRLAATRPTAPRLTEFYLYIAAGGMIGGTFNALVAPLFFSSSAEYPLVLVLASALRALGHAKGNDRPRDYFVDGLNALAIGALAAALMLLGSRFGVNGQTLGLAVGIAGLFAFSQSRRPIRFALCIGAILLAASVRPDAYGLTLHAERTFFGSYHVSTDPTGRFHALYHGTTLHGLQALGRAGSDTPLTYYHPTGPIGQAFARLPQLADAHSVAVVGLGIGSLSSYSHEGQQWTFYELDPAVERIARNSAYFTHLDACGTRCRVVIGDARQSLQRAIGDRYDVMVLDAFSSDAIPVHLLTREATALYLSRLAPGGVLAFHISNRHLDLGPVLAGVSRSLGLAAIEQKHAVTSAENADGESPSDWVLLSRNGADFDPLRNAGGWVAPAASSSPPIWTDNFSDILSVLRLR